MAVRYYFGLFSHISEIIFTHLLPPWAYSKYDRDTYMHVFIILGLVVGVKLHWLLRRSAIFLPECELLYGILYHFILFYLLFFFATFLWRGLM